MRHIIERNSSDSMNSRQHNNLRMVGDSTTFTEKFIVPISQTFSMPVVGDKANMGVSARPLTGDTAA